MHENLRFPFLDDLEVVEIHRHGSVRKSLFLPGVGAGAGPQSLTGQKAEAGGGGGGGVGVRFAELVRMGKGKREGAEDMIYRGGRHELLACPCWRVEKPYL